MNKTLVINDLLPIYQTTDTGEKVVDARELCGFLGVASRFADWIKNRIEKYGFVENVDYLSLSKSLENGGRSIDYILKLDMAKELAMVENNEQGRKARRYFIEVERRFKSGETSTAVPVANMERAKITRLLQMLDMAEREKLFTLETESALRKQIADMVLGDKPKELPAVSLPTVKRPKVPTIPGRWYTSKEIAGIAKVTVHLIATLASQHGLRSPEYCRYQSNCTTAGERVTGLTWPEYNEAGKNLLVQYAQERIAAGYVPKLRGKKVWRK